MHYYCYQLISSLFIVGTKGQSRKSKRGLVNLRNVSCDYRSVSIEIIALHRTAMMFKKIQIVHVM
jgi:hypothetical protein